MHLADDVPSKTPPARIPLDSAPFPFPDAIYRRRSIPASALERIRAEMTPWVFNEGLAGNKLAQHKRSYASGTGPPPCPTCGRWMRWKYCKTRCWLATAPVFLKRRSLGAGKGVVRATKADARGIRVDAPCQRQGKPRSEPHREDVSTALRPPTILPTSPGTNGTTRRGTCSGPSLLPGIKGGCLICGSRCKKTASAAEHVHGILHRALPPKAPRSSHAGRLPAHVHAFLNEVFPVRGRLVYAARHGLGFALGRGPRPGFGPHR